MAGFSDVVESYLLRYFFKKNLDAQGTPAVALPTATTGASAQYLNLYAALFTADPADAVANEVSGGSYGRVTIAADADDKSTSASSWEVVTTSGTAKRVSNKADITFPQATANWNSGNAITWFGLCDASSSGNLIFSGQIGSGVGVVVLNGNTLKFAGYGAGSPPGAVVVTVD